MRSWARWKNAYPSVIKHGRKISGTDKWRLQEVKINYKLEDFLASHTWLPKDTPSLKTSGSHLFFFKDDLNLQGFNWCDYTRDTLWLVNIAMENDPFIDGLPIKMVIFHGYVK